MTCNGVSYSPSNTQTVDPSFVSYSPKTATNDLRLGASDTAAKDKGVDLGSPYNTDKLGTLRPQGSGWDIGAYEYVQGGDMMAPAAPSGLVVR